MLRLFIVRLSKLKDPFGGDLNHLHHYLIKNYSLKITLLIYQINNFQLNNRFPLMKIYFYL